MHEKVVTESNHWSIIGVVYVVKNISINTYNDNEVLPKNVAVSTFIKLHIITSNQASVISWRMDIDKFLFYAHTYFSQIIYVFEVIFKSLFLRIIRVITDTKETFKIFSRSQIATIIKVTIQLKLIGACRSGFLSSKSSMILQ